jgi:hypothetical protein
MTLASLGQCGIIVRARLRLVQTPEHVEMRALAYDDAGCCGSAVPDARSVDPRGVRRCLAHRDIPSPVAPTDLAARVDPVMSNPPLFGEW